MKHSKSPFLPFLSVLSDAISIRTGNAGKQFKPPMNYASTITYCSEGLPNRKVLYFFFLLKVHMI